MAAAASGLHSLLHRHQHNSAAIARAAGPFETSSPPSILFKPQNKQLSCINTSLSAAITATSPSPSAVAAAAAAAAPSLELLAAHLAAQNFRRADEVTRRLLIELAGDAAKKRGYVFFSEVQFISPEDLLAVDRLWLEHSNGRFGYSVQRRLWEKSRRDFTRFFIKVGWMKKLDSSEVEQFNYRAFPDEFIWELTDGTPEGHLPLTNALRGTQLLFSVLTHPAFETAAVAAEEAEPATAMAVERAGSGQSGKSGRLMGELKPDYSF